MPGRWEYRQVGLGASDEPWRAPRRMVPSARVEPVWVDDEGYEYRGIMAHRMAAEAARRASRETAVERMRWAYESQWTTYVPNTSTIADYADALRTGVTFVRRPWPGIVRRDLSNYLTEYVREVAPPEPVKRKMTWPYLDHPSGIAAYMGIRDEADKCTYTTVDRRMPRNHVARVLTRYYDAPEKARRLFADMDTAYSQLGETIERSYSVGGHAAIAFPQLTGGTGSDRFYGHFFLYMDGGWFVRNKNNSIAYKDNLERCWSRVDPDILEFES